MTADRQTINAYARNAQDYATTAALAGLQAQMQDFDAFCAMIPQGGLILDWGSGPGHWAQEFRACGYRVDAVDACAEMAALAHTNYQIPTRIADFHALNDQARYDGIWANFSLLHADAKELPKLLALAKRALKSGAGFHIAMKTGSGEARDSLERYYSYYGVEALQEMLVSAGFTLLSTRSDRGTGLSGREEEYVVLRAHG